MIPQSNKGAGSFFSGHDFLDSPLVPIAPEQVRNAALSVVESFSTTGASGDEMGDTLAMLGITRQSLSEGLWMGSEGAA